MSLDFCVIITSYDREIMLKDLLGDIFDTKGEFKIKIFVFDDGSPNKYNLSEFQVNYIRYNENQGKKKYWKIINETFNLVKFIDSNYFIYLPDDVRLKQNFFSESVRVFEKINDNNKVCLSLLTDETRRNKPNWTNFKPIEFDEYYQTQWNDLCFISKKNFFETLKYKINTIPISIWDKNPNQSSGVGQQMSVRLHIENKKMYHLKNSLVTHGIHESKMNYGERINNKLIAI